MVNLKRLNKEELGKTLIPNKILTLKFKNELEHLTEKLEFNNINYYAITNLFFISIIITLLEFIGLYSYIYRFFSDYLNSFIWKIIIYAVLWFILNIITYYLLLLALFFLKDAKFKKMEEDIEADLPEFLDNLVSNLKGGISLEKALLKSVRKEQVSLLKEVTLVNEKIMMGMTVSEALSEFRTRYESPIINRTFFLIDEGLKGGGNLAQPLEKISANLKKIYLLEEEIKSNASGFTLIIRAITLLVAPLLFALAITLLTFIGNLFSILSKSGASFMMVSALPPEFSQYLVIFSYAMIILITLFSSLITSHLKNQKSYQALKYLPLYIIIALTFFIVFLKLLLGFFGGIIA